MAFKDLFKKRNKEEQKEMTTEEQIKKAEQDIREKGADEQTEKDRIDESVAAQEREEGVPASRYVPATAQAPG